MKRIECTEGNAGFTLVELLVTLAITAMIASFIVGGIDLVLRGERISRGHDGVAETDAAIAQLRSLLSRTVATNTIDEGTRMARLMFEGEADSLTFVTLSEGAAFPGGLMLVHLFWRKDAAASLLPGTLVVQTVVFRANARFIAESKPVILIRKVTGFSIRYFGVTTPDAALRWSPRWSQRDRLPLAIAAQIDVDGPQGPLRKQLQIALRLAALR